MEFVRLGEGIQYIADMSYLTLEVKIDHGKVVPKGGEGLPDSGIGLLTILQAEPSQQAGTSTLEALETLQRHLRIDQQAATQWASVVREARR